MTLNKLNVTQAKKQIASRDITISDLVHDVLRAIDRNNKNLNAFLSVNSSALSEAEKLDQQLFNHPAILEEKPLYGIPIAVKDNFLTKGIPTTASAKVLEGYIPQYESTVTSKLKKAGAIIIGKTNMDAWAHGSSTEASDFGSTKNPWDITKLPGGSSGGSAAAVAADMCLAAIGSETAGSIRQPAAWCGVVGMKPSYGRVSRYGVIAMASSTDSPGPITKMVEDARLILSVIAGEDENDATTITKKYKSDPIKPNKSLKLGIVKEYFMKESDQELNSIVEKAIGVLEEQGYKVQEVSLLDPKYAIAVYTIVQRAEVSSNLARYDGVRYGNYRDTFGEEAKRRVMTGTHVLSSGYYDAYYKKAQQARKLIVNNYIDVFKKVDLLLSPVTPTTALPIGATEGQAMFGEMQDVLVEASSLAGLPGITVPCGFVKGLPVGMQITGKFEDEQSVMQLASHYESLTNWNKTKANE